MKNLFKLFFVCISTSLLFLACSPDDTILSMGNTNPGGGNNGNGGNKGDNEITYVVDLQNHQGQTGSLTSTSSGTAGSQYFVRFDHGDIRFQTTMGTGIPIGSWLSNGPSFSVDLAKGSHETDIFQFWIKEEGGGKDTYGMPQAIDTPIPSTPIDGGFIVHLDGSYAIWRTKSQGPNKRPIEKVADVEFGDLKFIIDP